MKEEIRYEYDTMGLFRKKYILFLKQYGCNSCIIYIEVRTINLIETLYHGARIEWFEV